MKPPPPDSPTHSITCQVPIEVYEAFVELARADDRSVGIYLKRLVCRFVENNANDR